MKAITRYGYEVTENGAIRKARILPKVGDRIGAVCGPGSMASEDPGTVTEIVSSKWGDSAKVAMDDGRTEFCEGLTDVGIGWYLLKENGMKKKFTFALVFANGYEKTAAGVANTEKAAWKRAYETLSSDEKDYLAEFDCVDEEEVKPVVSSIPLAFIVKAIAEKTAIIPSPNSGNPRFFV